MADVFTTGRCDLPSVPRIEDGAMLDDAGVPAAPGTIQDCENFDTPLLPPESPCPDIQVITAEIVASYNVGAPTMTFDTGADSACCRFNLALTIQSPYLFWVEVVGGVGTGDGNPRPEAYYDGQIVNYGSDGHDWHVLDDCWVYPPNGENLIVSDGGNHQYYLARPAEPAGGRPVMVVVRSAEPAARVYVKIILAASAVGPISLCPGDPEEDCCHDPDTVDHCVSWLHVGVTQTYDRACDRWLDGDCIWVLDRSGQKLIVGKSYRADLIAEDRPNQLMAIGLPEDFGCADVSLLYATDVGNPTRWIVADQELGPVCGDDDSDSLSLSEGQELESITVYADGGSDDGSIGSVPWVSPDNIVATDSSYATASLLSPSAVTHYLTATYDFTANPIPTDAVIVGIEVTYRCSSTSKGPPNVYDNAVRLMRSGAIGTSDRSLAGVWPITDKDRVHGKSSDTWDEVWTPSDFNSGIVGSALSVQRSADGGSATARVDSARMTVYYTTPDGSSGSSGGAAVSTCELCYDDRLIIYTGRIQEFDDVACRWVDLDHCYISEKCGKHLFGGIRFEATYHGLLPTMPNDPNPEGAVLPDPGENGTTGKACKPLYLTRCPGITGTVQRLTAAGQMFQEWYDTYLCGDKICVDGPFDLGACDCITGGGTNGGGGAGGNGVTACCDRQLPSTLFATLSGVCDDVVPLVWNGSGAWRGIGQCCGQDVEITFTCTAPSDGTCDEFVISIPGWETSGSCGDCSCDPLFVCTTLTASSGFGTCTPGPVSIDVVVTE